MIWCYMNSSPSHHGSYKHAINHCTQAKRLVFRRPVHTWPQREWMQESSPEFPSLCRLGGRRAASQSRREKYQAETDFSTTQVKSPSRSVLAALAQTMWFNLGTKCHKFNVLAKVSAAPRIVEAIANYSCSATKLTPSSQPRRGCIYWEPGLN